MWQRYTFINPTYYFSSNFLDYLSVSTETTSRRPAYWKLCSCKGQIKRDRSLLLSWVCFCVRRLRWELTSDLWQNQHEVMQEDTLQPLLPVRRIQVTDSSGFWPNRQRRKRKVSLLISKDLRKHFFYKHSDLIRAKLQRILFHVSHFTLNKTFIIPSSKTFTQN